MALQQAYSFGGINLPAIYIRVHSIFGGKSSGWNSVVRLYASEAEAKSPRCEHFRELNVPTPYDPVNLNAFELIYGAIVALPEFKNSKLI